MVDINPPKLINESSGKRLVPNSSVPFKVRPPGAGNESSVLNQKLVKVGSTTSSELDKAVLIKMRDFELTG